MVECRNLNKEKKWMETMETIVWWNAGVESLNTEVEGRPVYGSTQGGESLNKEVEWRPWYGGTQGEKV